MIHGVAFGRNPAVAQASRLCLHRRDGGSTDTGDTVYFAVGKETDRSQCSGRGSGRQ